MINIYDVYPTFCANLEQLDQDLKGIEEFPLVEESVLDDGWENEEFGRFVDSL